MRRTVVVTIEKHLDVEIPDSHLTPEALREFSRHFHEVGNEEALFEYVAGQIARHGDHFVEGVGRAVYRTTSDDVTQVVRFAVELDDMEFDVQPRSDS